jgi:hypothetical protein
MIYGLADRAPCLEEPFELEKSSSSSDNATTRSTSLLTRDLIAPRQHALARAPGSVKCKANFGFDPLSISPSRSVGDRSSAFSRA